ncbi:RNA polymerase factor sigma-54 [Mameliella alba]|uniref:RNA polymerase factor sigma-54 n=1 Tax=Mameliella alba TaxID=561184 RepID=UPI000B529C86|nr:RNA polymerase sigma-54 factor [Mameliella alba]MBY6122370.1 RNA polymerase sigma-54 factor [Mameliella alba]OWV40735.1 RNA polymerase subunit sigma-54 [Mameliella alba]OWV55167.1 RNA polymerase subunit sigma-54 [Mameliella alba]BBU55232.1 RNA polymerase subunit sigma-54 [Mameliella alba]
MTPALGHVTRQAQTFVLHQSMALLRLTAAEVTELLTQAAEVNPHLLVRRPRRRFLVGLGASEALEATLADGACSLIAHVQTELSDLISRGGLMERIITRLMEDLEPSGWINTDLGRIARDLGIRETLVEATLRLVQERVSPTGLFARDLRECLHLQLAERGEVSPEMEAVLSHLDLLQTGGADALADKAGLSPGTVAACLARIRTLDPKPGARFDADPALTREPDARVTREGGAWKVRFNRDTEPSVEIAAIPRAGDNPDLAEALKQARSLKFALHLRQSATRQVIEALIARQTGFLDRGDAALRPLTQADLAEATGFHTSTVSRVMNGYLIETPQGVIPARTLCPGSVSRIGGAHCKAQVQARIRALVQAEDPASPLSDGDLAQHLRQEGIAVSRRVAAKYRQECGIARAALRRKSA